MPASRPCPTNTGRSHSQTPAQQPRRGAASFTYPDHADRAIWPEAILAAIATEERTSRSSLDGLPVDPSAWDWDQFFAVLVRGVGREGLGDLLNDQVLDEFLRKYPRALETTAGRTSGQRDAYQGGGPPPPAPTASSFDRAQTHHPDPHVAFYDGPPPPAPTASVFDLPFPTSSGRRSRPRGPFFGSPPPSGPPAQTTASFSSASDPHPGSSVPRRLPPGLLRRAALRATSQHLFLNCGLGVPKLHKMSHYYPS